jgi:hypothetical protein
MSDILSERFDRFLGGDCRPDAFERELLALCSDSPERAWQALALLDRYYRQHKISDRFCRALRQQLGAQAMRLEGHAVESPAPAATVPAATVPNPIAPFLMTPTAAESAPPDVAAPDTPTATATVAAHRTMPADANSLDVAGNEALLQALMRAVAHAAQRPARGRPPDSKLDSADNSTDDAAATDARPSRWRRVFQTSPALGLIAVVLGVVASTPVQDSAERLDEITSGVVTMAEPRAVESNREPAVVSLSSDRYLVQPHQKSIELTVDRAGSGDASFAYWTQASSARSNEDYVGTRARVVSIPAGSNSITLQVPILANPQRRHIDMFYVVIGSTDGGAGLGAIRRAAVFIFPAGPN